MGNLISFFLGVIATYFATFYFGPLKKYKNSIFNIDKKLKENADKICGGIYDENVRKILRELSSDLEASYKSLELKKLLTFFRQVKPENNIKKAAKNLILLSNISSLGQFKDRRTNNSLDCADIIDKIREDLDIKEM